MHEKEIAQKIVALYLSQETDEDKQKFIKLIKDIIKIIETMDKDDFVKLVDDFENHLHEIDDLKKSYGIDT
jgi:hypothetical protein